MLNILIPMAGEGSRFRDAGFVVPKPLIPVCGRQMIKLVIENLRPSMDHRFIFMTRTDHQTQYGLNDLLRSWAPNCEIMSVQQLTQGAACTVLMAKEHINNDDQLMIANCDQFVDVDIDEYISFLSRNQADGMIMTMSANDPKWSFVGRDELGFVNRIVEKEVISNEATVGIYNFLRGRDFVSAAESMISKNLRVNGEFYVAPAYNEMIFRGQHLVTFNVGSEGKGMYGLGIPDDLTKFESLPVSRKIAQVAT